MAVVLVMAWWGLKEPIRRVGSGLQPMERPACTVSLENFESLRNIWSARRHRLDWNCIFMLPPWLETWWQEFGSEQRPVLYAVREGETLLGIAPLERKGDCLFFIGSPDLCDCMDFIVAPGREADFFNTLLDHMETLSIRDLDLRCLRPDSKVLLHLAPIARQRGHKIFCTPDDTSLELALPSMWEEYLGVLTSKQRHEVRRKLRRIHEAGEVTFHILHVPGSLSRGLELFLRLFRQSGDDKAGFMTAQKESFFISLARAMAREDLLRLPVLELNGVPVAALLCFDYNGTVHLYNSGYDPQHRVLSAGLVSKILCIKDSIEKGKKKFDFLKGDEVYKHRLGGTAIPLHRCQISMNRNG
jgi:CelD/BcsL family acetyltransferase involved in cellulose biosynthesis